jgi:hypothetical protein
MPDIWYLLKDKDRYVYHYTKAATLIDYILPTGQLKFSKYVKLNDPYESKSFVFSFCGSVVENPDYPSIQSELNRAIKEHCRFGCFSRDIEAAVIQNMHEPGITTISRAYERGHSLPRMWAQYAEGHSGACLVFDRSMLDAQVRLSLPPGGRSIAEDVHYKNHTVLATIDKEAARTFRLPNVPDDNIADAIERHITRHTDELFFQKNLDWSQERERRWLVRRTDDADHFVPFGSSLVGIALGAEFPSKRRASVGEWCKSHPEVSVAQFSWQNGYPQPISTLGSLLISRR